MIRRTVGAAREAGSRLVGAGLVGSFEIVLVDDASTDGTGKIADELADDDPASSWSTTPRTASWAVRSPGFAAATGDVVLYTDADLPCELVEADKALRLMRLYEADLVSAYRFDRTSEGAQRAVYSYVYNHLRWSDAIRDVNFAFKLIRRRVLDHVELRSEGSFIDAELTPRRTAGGSAVQFGVDYIADPGDLDAVLAGRDREDRAGARRPARRDPPGRLAAVAVARGRAGVTPAPAGALRVLIVNADDFGLTPAVSRGILRFHRRAS